MIALTWIVSESWFTLVLHQHCLKHCPRLRLYIQEGSVYFLEGGPFLRVPPPAAQHDLVERVRTQHRLRQVDLSFLVPEKLPCVFYHLLVSELRVGLLLAEVQYLPQSHPEGPHITGCGELTQQDALP